jgi:hypothetical protein
MSKSSLNSTPRYHAMWHEFTLKDADPEETREQDGSGKDYEDDSDHDYDDQKGGTADAPTDSREDTAGSWEDPERPWSR